MIIQSVFPSLAKRGQGRFFEDIFRHHKKARLGNGPSKSNNNNLECG
jgi:hypothetical protein